MKTQCPPTRSHSELFSLGLFSHFGGMGSSLGLSSGKMETHSTDKDGPLTLLQGTVIGACFILSTEEANSEGLGNKEAFTASLADSMVTLGLRQSFICRIKCASFSFRGKSLDLPYLTISIVTVLAP